MFWVMVLLVAAVCGALGARIGGGPRPLGCLASIALGFIGAALGGWIAAKMNLPSILAIDLGGGSRFETVYAIMGAALFIALLGIFRRRDHDGWGPNDG